MNFVLVPLLQFIRLNGAGILDESEHKELLARINGDVDVT